MSDTAVTERKDDPTIIHVIYALYAASFLAGITALIGVIIAHVKAGDFKGSYLDSHITWQIRTFWVGLALWALGFLTIWIFGLGMLVWAVAYVWVIYRVIKGWIRLSDKRPLEDPTGWF